MKNSFPGYYLPTDDEFKSMWNSCLFTFDANVLLNLYRYSEDTRSELLDIFSRLSKRIWLSNQAAYEYHANRLSVISQQYKPYSEIRDLLDKNKEEIKKRLARHPYLDEKNIISKAERYNRNINKYLETIKESHPDFINNDLIRDNLNNLFKNKVGKPYTPEELEKIYKEGNTRYEKKIPPGYRDELKENNNKFGDLIMWYQIIDKSKQAEKPIILITDEKKEDWWNIFNGKIIGPRPELINELFDKGGVSFYLYQADSFIKYANNFLKTELKEKVIEEIQNIRINDEKLKNYSNISIIDSISKDYESKVSAIISLREIYKILNKIATYDNSNYLINDLNHYDLFRNYLTKSDFNKIINFFKEERNKLLPNKDNFDIQSENEELKSSNDKNKDDDKEDENNTDRK